MFYEDDTKIENNKLLFVTYRGRSVFRYQLWFLFTKLPEGMDPTLFTVIVLKPIIAPQHVVNHSNIC